MLVKPLITDLYRQIVPHRYPDNCAAAVLLKPVTTARDFVADHYRRSTMVSSSSPSSHSRSVWPRPAARAVAVSFHEVSSARIS